MDSDNLNFWGHFSILRKYLLNIFLFFILFTIITDTFNNQIMVFLLKPIGENTLIFLSPLDPIFFRLKIDLIIGFIFTIPVIFYYLMKFILPIVETSKRFFLILILGFSLFSSLIAVFYAFYYFFPVILSFLFSLTISQINLTISANNYINFIITFLFLLLLIFQIPIILVILSYFQILNPKYVSDNRKYIYVSMLILFAILTPTTDIISLLFILIPAIVCLELGIFISKIVYSKKK